MADPVKELLAKWTLDNSAWSQAVTAVRALLKQADAEDKVRAASSAAAQAASATAVKSEIALRLSLSGINAKDIAGLQAKVAAIKDTQAATANAAASALASTKQQIAAEQLKAATIKTALVEQKQAAVNALAFEKAYQAQLQEVAKNKAKAAAIFDDAYRAQVSEVQRNKKLQPQPRSAAAEYSSIPIVTANEKKQVFNPEKTSEAKVTADASAATSSANVVAGYAAQGEAAKLAGEEGQTAASRIVTANRAAVVTNEELVASYDELLLAQKKVDDAGHLVTFRQSVIKNKAYTGPKQNAQNSLDASIVSQAKAKEELAAAQLNYESKITAVQQQQIQSNDKLIAQDALKSKATVQIATPVQVEKESSNVVPLAQEADVVEGYEAQAAAAKLAGEAGQKAASESSSANKEVIATTEQASESYKRLAAAQLELQRTAANVNETKKSITSGTYKGTDEQAQNRLAADLVAQAKAKQTVKTITSEQATIEREILATKKQQELENQNLITEQAELKEATQRNLDAYNKQSALKRFVDPYNPAQNYSPVEVEEQTKSSLGAGSPSAAGGSVYQKDRAFVDMLSGRRTIRPLENLMTKLPIMTSLVNAAFPLLGITMFADMAVKAGQAIYNLAQKLEQFPNTVRTAFESQNLEIEKGNDELVKTTDSINNAIAKMEHKPQNNIKIAIDEARIAADQFAEAANKANEDLKKLLSGNNVNSLEAIFSKLQNLIPGVTKAPTDVTTKTYSKMQELEQAQQQAALRSQQLLQPNSPQSIAVDLGNRSGATAQQKAAAAAAKREQAAAKAAADASNNNYTKYLEQENAARSGYSIIKSALRPGRTTNFNEATTSISKEDYDKYSTLQKQLGQSRFKEIYGIQSVLTPEQTQTANANNLAAIGPALQGQYAGAESQQDKADQNTAQQKQKALEEAQQAARDSLQQAQAHYEALKELAADALETQKLDIEKLADANDVAYKNGTIAAQAYFAQKDALSKKNLQNVLADIETERAADLAILAKRAATEPAMGVGSKGYTDEQKKINEQYNTKAKTATYSSNKEISANDIQAYEANAKIVSEGVQAALDSKLKALQLETDATKAAFDQRTISAQDYLARQKQNIADELQANIDAIDAEETLYGENDARGIALEKRRTDAVAASVKASQDLAQGSNQTLLQGVSAPYTAQTSMFSAEENLQNAPGNVTQLSQRQGLNAAEISLAKEQLQQLNVVLQTVEQTTGAYTKDWFEVYNQILNINTELAKLVQQSKELSTSLPQMGSTLAAGVGAAGGVFTSRYAKGLESSLGSAAQTMQQAPGFAQGIMNGPWVSKTDIPNADSTKNLGGIDVGGTIDDFAKHLTSAVGALGSFISSINNAGSASAGGIAGGMSGASLGSSITSSMGGPGGALSSMGSMAGPFGALIGGALGSAMGAIMGQKQEEVQDDINQLQADFKSIMNSYSSNNSSLAATVTQLQQLVLEAQSEEAQTKKGGSQFTQLIQQYNEQIGQLEDQQAQLMSQMQQNLTQISSPEAYQPLIQSIQQILQQYTQYIGAAQNATQLAQANNFLTQSLQNLATSYTEQLQQNQETAIQDALNLNQLYNQRNQLEEQYLQQVRSIEGQGTLTRSVTQSQSKYSQLYNLDVNTANSLDTINQQIALAQYQVAAEQQIFSLATTKAGLEQQLLQLQEKGVNLDMSRIVAMQNVLADIQQTGYSLVNLATINTSDPNALMTLLLQILAQQLGVTAGGSGTSLTGASALSYITNAQMGYGATRGTTL